MNFQFLWAIATTGAAFHLLVVHMRSIYTIFHILFILFLWCVFFVWLGVEFWSELLFVSTHWLKTFPGKFIFSISQDWNWKHFLHCYHIIMRIIHKCTFMNNESPTHTFLIYIFPFKHYVCNFRLKSVCCKFKLFINSSLPSSNSSFLLLLKCCVCLCNREWS